MTGRRGSSQADVEREAQLAGVDLDVATTGSSWLRPSDVTVSDGWVRWRENPGDRGRWINDPKQELLTPFAALASSDDLERDVETFASRWGTLGLCEHNLPHTHRVGHGPAQVDSCHEQVDGDWFVEPIEPWRAFAGELATMLNAVVGIHTREPVRSDVWAPLVSEIAPGLVPMSAPRGGRVSIQEAVNPDRLIGPIRLVLPDKAFVSSFFDRWFELGNVRPAVEWLPSPRLGFRARTLFGALALRAAVVATGANLKICNYCNEAYATQRGEHATTRCCAREACRLKRSADTAKRHRANRPTLGSSAADERL